MAIFEPTEEQQKIENSKNKNIIVSASAGSGKTTVMIRKICNIIVNEKTSVKNLLVLTYTKAAALEMKERLEKSLYSLSERDSFLLEEIDQLANADICTFHSFCQKLIKRYFYALGINPNFTIAEGGKEMQLKNQAVARALRVFEKDDAESYFFLLDIYCKNRRTNTIEKLIFDIYNYKQTSKIENWENLALSIFDNDKAENDCNKWIVDKVQRYVKKLYTLQQNYSQLGLDSYVIIINQMLTSLDAVKLNNSLGKNIEIFLNYEGGTLKDDSADIDNKNEQLKKIRKYITDFRTYLKEHDFGDQTEIKKSYYNCRKIAEKIFKLENVFEKEYNTVKNKKNIFDYSDLEQNTLKLLENDEICQQLKSDYKYLFIDEFQDANLIQESILSSLAKSNNRFMVGDVKQCIYAFRASNPEIFLNKQSEYSQDVLSENLKLNSNFRSTPKILTFCNLIFDNIMTKETCGIDYKLDGQFTPKANYKSDGQPEVQLQIVKLEKQESKKLEGIYSVANDKRNLELEKAPEMEARVIGEKIISFLATPMYDSKTEKFYMPTYNDMTILIRSRGSYQGRLADALRKMGIPTTIQTKKFLYEEKEVQSAINFLKAVDNLKDDIALVNTMLSEYGCFSEQELADIRLENIEATYFYECCLNSSNKKVEGFLSMLRQARELLQSVSPEFMLNKYIAELDIKEKLLQRPNGEVAVRNLEKFLTALVDNDFYEILNDPEKMQISCENITSANAVNITTIHASKGLEYPIVFVANLSSSLWKEPRNFEMELSAEGIGVKNYDTKNRTLRESVFINYLKRQNKKSELAEKIRLLYVACTRAKNHLVLVGSVDKLSFDSNIDALDYNDYLEMIVSSLPEKCIKAINNGKCEEHDGFSFDVYSDCDFDYNKTFVEKFALSEKVLSEIKSKLSQNYLHDTTIAVKSSVTKLLTMQEGVSYNACPNIMRKSEHLSDFAKNEIGSLYHLILEKIDINCSDLDKNIVEVIVQLKNNKKYEKIISEIDTNNIKKCAEIIKKLCGNAKIYREKQFMMCLPHNEIVNSSSNDKVLIQGVVDLFSIEKSLLIDYKYSMADDNTLAERYRVQLQLYKKAIEKYCKIEIDNVYILNINNCKLIKIN